MAFGERLRVAGRMEIHVKDRHALRGWGGVVTVLCQVLGTC